MKSIWIREDGTGPERRKSITTHQDRECVSPLGVYSMSPVLSADRPIEKLSEA